MSIVLASLAVASVFLTIAVTDFENRAVVTTIETTTASLRVRKVNFYLNKREGMAPCSRGNLQGVSLVSDKSNLLILLG